MISRNPGDPLRPAAKFSKTFTMAGDRFGKSPVTLLKILKKKGESRYRTFKKKSSRRLPDFWRKKSGHDPGIPGKILPFPGVLVRLALKSS